MVVPIERRGFIAREMGVLVHVLLLLLLLFVRGTEGFVDADKYVCRCEKFAFKSKPFVAIWNSPTNGYDSSFFLFAPLLPPKYFHVDV